jgi:DNA mismatch endonuclease, patch repair protein
MQAVKSKNTAIEIRIRQLLYAQGYRYRLHRGDLPGCPDLVFGSRKKVIFIHGCFWHGHQCTRGKRVPKTNTGYWTTKISRNSARDAATRDRLKDLGWKVSVAWECELTKRPDTVIRKLARFLGPVGSDSV